ncbi:hypothetical protein [Paenibacillus arenosi]|uniref:Uncharacterized protein n=1 Tax=Paenibacillus arenosi TaxID=2774142 RepID=A0ABR9AXI6_9BACL|nr:hypothetical protein [Paenibacillus arenosi]MBD8498794.1 hypothetical protein [Paenibacillus arenosi]
MLKSVNEFYDERITKIDWFSNCGRQIDKAGTKFVYAKNWGDVEKNINSNWDNLKLQIRNRLTSSLHENFRQEYREWNKITIQAKKLLSEGELKKVSTFIQDNNLKTSVYDSIEWDLLTAMMEYAYSPYIQPGFHTELFELYEFGHIPCGWKGKSPEGTLLVF